MASILRPFQNLLSPGLRQVPTGQLAIDWTRPLTNGLMGCWVPGAMGFDNIGLNLLTLTRKANTAFDSTQHGPGLKSSGTNASAYATAPDVFKSWTKASIFYCGMRNGNQGAQNAESLYYNVSYDDINSSPFYNIALCCNTTDGIVAFWSHGASLGSLRDTAANSLPALNNTFTAGATFDTAGNVRIYKDGIFLKSGAFGAGSPGSTATSILAIHAPGGELARASNNTANIVCFWNRVLSDEEMCELNRNSYSFLIPAEYEMSPLYIPPYLRQRHYRFRTDAGAVDATPTWGSQEDSMVV